MAILFGHGVEILSDFLLSHGESVAVGIGFAAYLAWRLGFCTRETMEIQMDVLEGLGMPCRIPDSITAEQLIRVMSMDKKAKGREGGICAAGICGEK
ncbi:MAG: hypothetical protein ACLR23_07520 [Clostridia bacterium]